MICEVWKALKLNVGSWSLDLYSMGLRGAPRTQQSLRGALTDDPCVNPLVKDISLSGEEGLLIRDLQ